MHSKLVGLCLLPLLSNANNKGKCVEGNCGNGKGVKEFDSGDVYFGEFAGNFRHGKGIISYNKTGRTAKNNKKYDGHWELDLYCGSGRLELQDGTVLRGTFDNNQLSNGKISYINGSWIEGEFVDGVPNGKLVWMDVDEDRTSYIGNWLEGRWHGPGILEKENGFKYNGTFVIGNMTGFGKLIYPLSELESEGNWYEGTVVDGQRHGKGLYHEAMKDHKWWEWNGEFVNDEMLGKGIMTRSNGHQDPDRWYEKEGTYPWTDGEWEWEEEDEEEEEESVGNSTKGEEAIQVGAVVLENELEISEEAERNVEM
jgi:hypothetical protein